MTTLVLSQRDWSCFDSLLELQAVLAVARDAACRTQLEAGPVLVLLPQASSGVEAPTEAQLLELVGSLARATGVWIAGSARVCAQAETGGAAAAKPSIVAFLVGDDGRLRLRTAKITPELVNGFDNTGSALGREAPFAVVATPFGQVGLLPGEDILYTPYARALVFHGAELILNSATERSDDLFDIRQLSRFVRAGDNACYVATASAASVRKS